MHTTDHTLSSSGYEHTGALFRHFADLRDGSGGAATSRQEKERVFAEAVALLDPYAGQALGEIDAELLLGTGEITATGVRRSVTAGLESVLVNRMATAACGPHRPDRDSCDFCIGSPHPHLRGGTVGDWPLNVFDAHQAAAELCTLRTIAAAENHNLVFQTGGDYRLFRRFSEWGVAMNVWPQVGRSVPACSVTM